MERALLTSAFCLLPSAFAFPSIPMLEAAQAAASTASSIVLRLPQSFETTGLEIRTYLSGCFGGWGSSIQGVPGVLQYPLQAGCFGKPGASLKGYVYQKGYGFETFVVDLSSVESPRTITIEPRPLGTVRLAGHVSLPKDGPAGLTLLLAYTADWQCEFFGLFDCLLGYDSLSSAPIPVDGAFRFDVPDLAHDPALTKFARKGGFHLRVTDGRMNTVFWCEPDRIPVAPTYPADLRLTAVVR